MAKTRLQIPKAIRDKVLKEFNHRCAICGTDRPQVHHIDEDPSNNELLNLIPLCPNCHLVDQHNPTTPMDSEKLRLFRQFKDPTILKPQFHPLFVRMKFLDQVKGDSKYEDLRRCSMDLVDFVSSLEMGSFYSKTIWERLRPPAIISVHSPDFPIEINRQDAEEKYRAILLGMREEVYSLVIELLRYQNWPSKN